MNEMPSVIFELQAQKFAFSTNYVKSIEKLPDVAIIPRSPKFLRGVVNFRGSVIDILDLRAILGFKGRREEVNDFIELMEMRERDHRNWLAELEKSVEQNSVFSLTTDPHQCAFGKWYDNFNTDSFILKGLLEKFDKPHKNIHAIAEKIEKHKSEGDLESARKIIKETREKDLAEMVNLFSEVKNLFEKHSSELIIILDNGIRKLGVTVDRVLSIQSLKNRIVEKGSNSLIGIKNKGIIEGLCENGRKDEIIVKIDDNRLLTGKIN